MDVLWQVAIAVGGLAIGGSAKWLIDKTRGDGRQDAEVKALKERLDALTATKQLRQEGGTGRTPHQELMYALREVKALAKAAAEEAHEIRRTLEIWEKHFWEQTINALRESAAASRESAAATTSLISALRSGAIHAGSATDPGSSSV